MSPSSRITHALTWRQIVELYRRLSPESGGRELAMLKWGLVPFWAREAKIGYSMINARAETVATKAFKRRR